MNPVFERNLGELMRRAYVPARPSAEFRERLRARVLAELVNAVESGGTPGTAARAGTSARRGREVGLALFQGLAAAAAVLALAMGWRAIAPGEPERSVGGAPHALTVARGPAPGIRGGPDGAEALLWYDTELDVAAGAEGPVEVLALTGDRFHVEAGSRATFHAARRVDLRSGELRVVKGAHSPGVSLAAPGGRVGWERGEVVLRVERDRTHVRARGGHGMAAGVRVDGDALGLLAAGTWHSAGMASVEPDPPRVALRGDDGGGVAAAAPEDEREGGTVLADGAAMGPSPDQVPRPSAGSGTLRGRVTDEASGAPIGEFRVWVREEIELPRVTEPVCYRVDDEAGRFEIEGLAAGSYSVLVESQGRAAWRTTGLELGGDPSWLDVALGAGGSLRGYVLDAESRTPIAGALVLAQLDLPQQIAEMQGFARTPMPFAHARTDPSGAFLLENLSVGPHTIRVSDLEHAPTWVEIAALAEDEIHDVGEVTLASGGTVLGRVEQEDGSPFPGAEIIASRIDMQGSTPVLDFGLGIAGPDGSYRIDGLPEGVYIVLSISEAPSELPEWSRLQQTTVRRDGESRVDFLSPLRTRTLTGRLKDAAGEPVGGWFLTLAAGWNPDGFTDWLATRSSEDGRFRFVDVAPGPHQLYMGVDTNQVLMRIALIEMPEIGDLELELELPDTVIRGKVVDAASGETVQGEVLVEHFDPDRAAWIFAGRGYRDGEERFRFDYLAPGTYRVTAADVEGLADRTSEPFELRAATPVDLELALSPAGRLEIEVTDPEGSFVPGARVGLRAAGREVREFGSMTRTDRAGAVSIGHLPLAEVEVVVRAPGYVEQVRNVTATVEGTLVRVTLQPDAK